jgi:hypothetical protein
MCGDVYDASISIESVQEPQDQKRPTQASSAGYVR